jgi:predicted NAD-dependent protein-ADP-ribosyltransferase YbiA (DUF1768 family)
MKHAMKNAYLHPGRVAGGSEMAGQFVTEVNDAEFEKEVLQSETPVLGGFLGRLVRSRAALSPRWSTR